MKNMKKIVSMLATASILSILAFLNIVTGESDFGQTNKFSKKPILSSDWLELHLNDENLIVIDIRSSNEYKDGHIKGSINIPFEVPFSAWITMRDDLLLELPDKENLFKVISEFGINKSSHVVIVTAIDNPPFAAAGGLRVADTLIYTGIENVSILDGGYPKWIREGKEVTQKIPTIKPNEYKSNIKKDMIVDINYVYNIKDKSILLDARSWEVYSGQKTEPWTGEVRGHIPEAKSLPAPNIWHIDGTYKSKKELLDLAKQVIGENEDNKEIILYCGVGGYGSSWWYILTQVLEYKNVKLFDGSAQEWIKYYEMEI